MNSQLSHTRGGGEPRVHGWRHHRLLIDGRVPNVEA